MSRSTRMLLSGGILTPALFLLLWAVQAFTREGFRPTYHPMSLLSLGEGGWVQIVNFILTGLLVAGAGVGLRRALGPGRLARWGGALVMAMGAGLVIAGVFVTDAGAGFPAGAPQGAPVMSWHGAVHEVGFVLTQLAFVAAAVVFAVLSFRTGRRAWGAACIAFPIVAVLAAALGVPETMALRLVVSAVVELAAVATLCLGALRGAVGAASVLPRTRADYNEPHGSASSA